MGKAGYRTGEETKGWGPRISLDPKAICIAHMALGREHDSHGEQHSIGAPACQTKNEAKNWQYGSWVWSQREVEGKVWTYRVSYRLWCIMNVKVHKGEGLGLCSQRLILPVACEAFGASVLLSRNRTSWLPFFKVR